MSEKNQFNIRAFCQRQCSTLTAKMHSSVAFNLYNTAVTVGVPWYNYLYDKVWIKESFPIWTLELNQLLNGCPFLPLSPHPYPFCSIISRHKVLEGSSQGSVEYQALQLVSSLEHYGVEWHWVRDADGQRLAIGVGPEGIAICKEDFSLVNRYAPLTHLQITLYILIMMVRFML